MACACANKKKSIEVPSMTDITIEPIAAPEEPAVAPVAEVGDERALPSRVDSTKTVKSIVEVEAENIALKNCYLCTKKHLARAQEFFQEYHTGYPDYIKNLVHSVKVAEDRVRAAFLWYQKAMAQMNMAEGELVGKDANGLTMREEHLSLANRIRTERLKLSDDPMHIPDFDQLLVDVNILQYRVMESL